MAPMTRLISLIGSTIGIDQFVEPAHDFLELTAVARLVATFVQTPGDDRLGQILYVADQHVQRIDHGVERRIHAFDDLPVFALMLGGVGARVELERDRGFGQHVRIGNQGAQRAGDLLEAVVDLAELSSHVQRVLVGGERFQIEIEVAVAQRSRFCATRWTSFSVKSLMLSVAERSVTVSTYPTTSPLAFLTLAVSCLHFRLPQSKKLC
jgi:hypothetical protein